MLWFRFNPSKIADLGKKLNTNIRYYFGNGALSILFFPFFIIGAIFTFLFYFAFFLFILPQVDTEMLDNEMIDKIPKGLLLSMKIAFFLPSIMAIIAAIPLSYIFSGLQLLFMLPTSAIYKKRVIEPVEKELFVEYTQTEEYKQMVDGIVDDIVNDRKDDFDETDDYKLFEICSNKKKG